MSAGTDQDTGVSVSRAGILSDAEKLRRVEERRSRLASAIIRYHAADQFQAEAYQASEDAEADHNEAFADVQRAIRAFNGTTSKGTSVEFEGRRYVDDEGKGLVIEPLAETPAGEAPDPPRDPRPIPRSPTGRQPLLKGTVTICLPTSRGERPSPVTVQVVILAESQDETATDDDLPELKEAGWFGHDFGTLDINWRVIG